jgi:hypothetical protein
MLGRMAGTSVAWRAVPSAPAAAPLLGIAALAAAYYGAAKIGYELEFAGPVAGVVFGFFL